MTNTLTKRVENSLTQIGRLANKLLTIAGTDLFDAINPAEKMGECATIDEAIKNPLFFKGLALLMVDYMQTLKRRKDDRVTDAMCTREYWEKDFLPTFFTTDISHHGYNDKSYYLAEIYLKEAFEHWYNGDRALQFLQRVFRLGEVDITAQRKSIFRDGTWKLSSNPLKWAIQARSSSEKGKEKWYNSTQTWPRDVKVINPKEETPPIAQTKDNPQEENRIEKITRIVRESKTLEAKTYRSDGEMVLGNNFLMPEIDNQDWQKPLFIIEKKSWEDLQDGQQYTITIPDDKVLFLQYINRIKPQFANHFLEGDRAFFDQTIEDVRIIEGGEIKYSKEPPHLWWSFANEMTKKIKVQLFYNGERH